MGEVGDDDGAARSQDPRDLVERRLPVGLLAEVVQAQRREDHVNAAGRQASRPHVLAMNLDPIGDTFQGGVGL